MRGERQLHFDVSERRMPDSICRNVNLRADGESAQVSVSYEICDTSIGDLPVLDGLVQGVLFHCMRRGMPLRIHGNLSASAIHNLHEYQRAWALWRPEIYHQVDLVPDAVIAEAPRSTRAIQAFSGGVDATFTLVSNKYLLKEQGGYDVTAALLVHGFDVGYENTDEFNKLAERCRKALDRVGVELKLVRTNSKALNLQSWLDSTSLQIAACLHQFSNHYGRALMGSAYPYDTLCMPIGSNPITDHLLSGDLLSVIHDGAGYSRTEKVAEIARFPFLVEHLKVCWEGRRQHENCGTCEKCVRTRLNFAAAGIDEPACFDGPFDASMLRTLRLRSHTEIVELEGIVSYARRRGIAYPWLAALRRRILISRVLTRVESALGWPTLKDRLRSTMRPVLKDIQARRGRTLGLNDPPAGSGATGRDN